jgi:transcriptional regulator with PAS, ATPase and Fis domain
VDVRVIAATNRNLEQMLEKGEFREDLYYRLNVVGIHLPPLRERPGDIAPLAHHFAARLGRRLGRPLSLADTAVAWLEAQPWRGNVRELEHAMGGGGGVGDGSLRDAVEDAERRAITAALEASAGNRRATAKQLGVSLRTLFYKMERYRIE